jgi:DNA-binding HxlR family transcriptional regulator
MGRSSIRSTSATAKSSTESSFGRRGGQKPAGPEAEPAIRPCKQGRGRPGGPSSSFAARSRSRKAVTFGSPPCMPRESPGGHQPDALTAPPRLPGPPPTTRQRRFNALGRAIEANSQKMLGQVLKSLERDGLVGRRAIATVPVMMEYSIMPLGAARANAVDPLRAEKQSEGGAERTAPLRRGAQGYGSANPRTARPLRARLQPAVRSRTARHRGRDRRRRISGWPRRRAAGSLSRCRDCRTATRS